MTVESTAPFHDLDSAHFHRQLTDTVAEILTDQLQASKPGNCLRISTLPQAVIEELAQRLFKQSDARYDAYICLLIAEDQSAHTPWEVKSTQLVALRNAEDKPLLVFVPPGLHTSAEDSFDVSTFAEVPLRDLNGRLRSSALDLLPADVRTGVDRLLAQIEATDVHPTADQIIHYLLTVSDNGATRQAAGQALYQLGLIPDRLLLADPDPDKIAARIKQNVKVVQTLADPTETLLTRIYRLRIEPDSIQTALYRFLSRHIPEDAITWGRLVATDPAYQDLSLDRWSFITATPECLLYIRELPLPVRQDTEGIVKVLNPNVTKSLAVSWETVPDIKNVAQLDHFRLEVVNSGGSIMHETGQIAVRKGASRKMTYQFKDLAELDLPEDIYFLRVRAYTMDGALLNREEREERDALRDPANPLGKRINETEDFLCQISDADPMPSPTAETRNQTVTSAAEARLLGQLQLLDRGEPPARIRGAKPETAGWLGSPPPTSYTEAEIFNIRYDIQASYSLPLSGLLVYIERQTLSGNDPLGRWQMDLRDSVNPAPRIPNARTTPVEASNIPEAFRSVRAQLFTAISAVAEQESETPTTLSGAPAGGQMVTATVDLRPHAPLIAAYLAAYDTWLQHLSQELALASEPRVREILLHQIAVALDIDVVQVEITRDARSSIVVYLLAPTHPLRLWWHQQYQHLIEQWIDQALQTDRPKETLSSAARTFLRTLIPRYFPPVLGKVPGQFVVDSGALTPFWQLYLPPDLRDSQTIRARLEKLLGLRQNPVGESTISSADLIQKLRRYLLQHPYVSTLKINVFNPGDAQLIAESLVNFQNERRDLKYQIHLFGHTWAGDELGSALADLLSPSRQTTEVQDEFAQSSTNHLFPKLRFTRNTFQDFLADPQRFTAHISVLFNIFPVEIRLDSTIRQERSSYLHGLIQEPVIWLEGEGAHFSWHRQLAPTAVTDLAGTPGASAQIATALKNIAGLQAALQASTAVADHRLSIQLNLDLDAKSLLYQVHERSDWVLTVDSNLGVEYFDTIPERDHPIFLLDFNPEYVASGEERLMLTTRASSEVLDAVRPVLGRYGLGDEPDRAALVLHMVRSLSGRLALKLLTTPTHADEAISFALARLFLEQNGLLAGHLVIPLDAHIDWFTQARRDNPITGDLSMRRSDLLLVEVDPTERMLVFHVLEVKSRHNGAEPDLETTIDDQITNAISVLRQHFEWQPGRPDHLVQIRRLSRLLQFYLARARRYKLISRQAVDALEPFFSTLDAGYGLRFARHALIFDLSRKTDSHSNGASGTTFHYLGMSYIQDLVQNGLRRLTNLATLPAIVSESAPAGLLPPPTMTAHSGYAAIRDSFATTGFGRQLASEVVESIPKDGEIVAESETPTGPTPIYIYGNSLEPSAPAPQAMVVSDPVVEHQESASPSPIEILLGDTHLTSQYGVLGVGSGKTIGLDLDGVNTMSIFGVQGAGKSYTMGTIIEMATQPLPGLNQLPRPLATVVFHYHAAQDYKPEFVSMAHPNNEPDEIARLQTEFGAAPRALDDVLLLTTQDKVASRQAEFPTVAVQPISFRSSELTARDWMFLMGAIGNQSLYITQINRIMRDCRDNLTLDNLRHAIENSRLSESQKELAAIRLDFTAEFIDDSEPTLASRLQPQRLIIVDLRDELIQKEQALGLFVVMLNILSSVGSEGTAAFNKLIVFDEAHKYMTGGELTDQVVSVIRQMRHQGVSVLIASQDPKFLPGSVIELSSILILHRFNSPDWLRHIQKSIVALRDLSPAQLAQLKPGEAYVWANKATEPIYSQKAVRIRLRPRTTLHGGATKRANLA